MDAQECIVSRRSIRNFTQEAIDKETIESIVKTSQFSPSWKNSQTPRYTVIQDKSVLNKIASECVNGFTKNELTIKNCSALVVLSYVTGRCGYEKDGSFTTKKGDHWEMFDAGIAAQTFCLAAHDKGIGSVILGIFDEDKIADVISLPEDQIIATLIAIGYPESIPDAPKRKELTDILSFI